MIDNYIPYDKVLLLKAFLSGWKCSYGIIWDALEEEVEGITLSHSDVNTTYDALIGDIPLGIEEEIEKTYQKLLNRINKV